MTLGMLSWSMAVIQDHRSYMFRKSTANSPETYDSEKSCAAGVFWHWEEWAQVQADSSYLVGIDVLVALGASVCKLWELSTQK